MTRKLFWSDPYLTVLETTVSTVSGSNVTLAETIFFAFSGGQESDRGTIAGREVLSAKTEGLEIVYTLADDHRLVVGQPVLVNIEWGRRLRLMRLHFAAELVLELFYKNLSGVNKVGAHIAQDKARIDFAWPQSLSPLLPRIESEANALIRADLEIKTGFADAPNERRYWELGELDGFARVPCGGTHVRRTGEVGAIRLKRNNKGRGIERVEIYLAA